jgi:hypothetical protein
MKKHLAELLDVVLYVVDLSAEGHLPAGDHNLSICQAAREKLICEALIVISRYQGSPAVKQQFDS